MPRSDLDRTIQVVAVADAPSDAEAKGLFSGRRQATVKEIPVERLREQLSAIRRDLSTLIAEPSVKEGSDLRLSELSVQVEITASGGVRLIGTAEVGATAAMTLTFSR